MKYNKLVRDKIPEIISRDGKTSKFRIADDEEYFQKLKEKLKEETTEFVHAGNLEELADLLEVIKAICEHNKTSLEEIEKIRKGKEEARGSFRNKIILEEIF